MRFALAVRVTRQTVRSLPAAYNNRRARDPLRPPRRKVTVSGVPLGILILGRHITACADERVEVSVAFKKRLDMLGFCQDHRHELDRQMPFKKCRLDSLEQIVITGVVVALIERITATPEKPPLDERAKILKRNVRQAVSCVINTHLDVTGTVASPCPFRVLNVIFEMTWRLVIRLHVRHRNFRISEVINNPELKIVQTLGARSHPTARKTPKK